MDRLHAKDRFWTTPPVVDCEAGSTTLRLHRETEGRAVVAAEVIFWDAAGQYFLETFNCDVPIDIVEVLIAEAKDKIKYK